jgi:4-hydroxy-tetrahydrodipicolinate reductase
MKIALFGYGKMGKAIEQLALAAGDEIVLKIDSKNESVISADDLKKAEVIIEFSRPDRAVSNIEKSLKSGVPVVSGTTGWYENLPHITALCHQTGGAFFHASNFSIGVNIFFEINKKLAEIMAKHPSYAVSMHETHHVHKVDAPSGTALTLATAIIKSSQLISDWKAYPDTAEKLQNNGVLPIYYSRKDEVPGTHQVSYTSTQDSIELTHTAFTREGFASGALTAAKWLVGKKGVFTMHDLLNL